MTKKSFSLNFLSVFSFLLSCYSHILHFIATQRYERLIFSQLVLITLESLVDRVN